MNFIKKFLIRRKQSDAVKFFLLFIMLGIYMLCAMFVRGVSLYGIVSEQTEYVLVSGSETGITSAEINDIKAMSFVAYAGRQYETEYTLFYNGKGHTLPCIMLSGEYVEKIYGINEKTGMQVLYINEAALREMNRTDWYNEEKNRLENTYFKAVTADGSNKTVRLVVLDGLSGKDDISAICISDSATLEKNPTKLRVAVKENDLLGENLKKLQQNGLRIENSREADRIVWEQQTEYMRIKYEAFICILCFAAALIIKSSTRCFGTEEIHQ